jgi:hypothetical protein
MFTLYEQEEAPQPQRVTGLSKDERIKEFLRLDAQIKDLSYERKAHASALLEIAAEERNGQKTVHLQASNGARVAVEFKSAWECNAEEVEVAKELLKDRQFNNLFKTTYTPKVRELRKFLNTVYSDEAWEVAKQIIKEHVREVESSPYVCADKTKS